MLLTDLQRKVAEKADLTTEHMVNNDRWVLLPIPELIQLG